MKGPFSNVLWDAQGLDMRHMRHVRRPNHLLASPGVDVRIIEAPCLLQDCSLLDGIKRGVLRCKGMKTSGVSGKLMQLTVCWAPIERIRMECYRSRGVAACLLSIAGVSDTHSHRLCPRPSSPGHEAERTDPGPWPPWSLKCCSLTDAADLLSATAVLEKKMETQGLLTSPLQPGLIYTYIS